MGLTLEQEKELADLEEFYKDDQEMQDMFAALERAGQRFQRQTDRLEGKTVDEVIMVESRHGNERQRRLRSRPEWRAKLSKACRAANRSEETRNRMGKLNREEARVHELNGKMYSASELAAIAGLHVTTIRYRLSQGMSVSEAVERNDRRYKKTSGPID